MYSVGDAVFCPLVNENAIVWKKSLMYPSDEVTYAIVYYERSTNAYALRSGLFASDLTTDIRDYKTLGSGSIVTLEFVNKLRSSNYLVLHVDNRVKYRGKNRPRVLLIGEPQHYFIYEHPSIRVADLSQVKRYAVPLLQSTN